MALAAAKRLFDQLHEEAPFHDGSFKRWAKKASPTTPFHYLDGTVVFLAPAEGNPGDLFTTVRDAAPWDEVQPTESSGPSLRKNS